MPFPLNNLNHDFRSVLTCNDTQVPLDGHSASNPSEFTRCTSGSECLASTTSSTAAMDASGGRRRVHPAAMVLRLRVTQVVCGIITCVLGAVACIEERGEFRVSTGIVAGAATVVASIASIHATFNGPIDRARWIQYTQTTKSGGTSCVLSSLWAIAIVTNMVMLAFVFMAFISSNRNLVIIGSLELALGLVVLIILVVIMCMAVHCKELQRK